MKHSEKNEPQDPETLAEAAARAMSQEETPEAGETSPDLAAEAARFKDLALRAQADLDNYRKRAVRDGELVDIEPEMTVTLTPKGLNVLAPSDATYLS